jgi:hypothetical protein
MDDSDKASEYEGLFRESAIAFRKASPKLTGMCLNCGVKTKGAYCSADCREDWERIQRMKRIGRRHDERRN